MLAEDQRDRLVQQGERLSTAALLAVAFHEPKRLEKLGRDHDRDIGLTDPVKKTLSDHAGLIRDAGAALARLHASREAKA